MLLLTVCSTCIRFISARKHRKTFHHPNKGRPSSTQTKEENKPSSPQRKKKKCQHSKKGRKQNFQHTNKGGKQNVFNRSPFCRFCVVIRFFSSPLQRPMASDFEGVSIPDFIHYILFVLS